METAVPVWVAVVTPVVSVASVVVGYLLGSGLGTSLVRTLWAWHTGGGADADHG